MTHISDEELKKLIQDFPYFLSYVFNILGLPGLTRVQERLAWHLNDITHNGSQEDERIFEAARGVGKSWITAVYVVWRLLRNPNERVVVVSASGPKAIEIATFIRNLLDLIPVLNHLVPRKDQRDSVLSFDVNGSSPAIAPSVSCLGITGQITGKRASLIIADDIEIPSNSYTETMRQKLISRVQEFPALLIPDMPSLTLFLGTPQSMESIYNKIEATTTIIPAEVPEDPTIYEGKLDDWVMTLGKPGAPTDIERFPTEVLLKRRSKMGESAYRLQMMLDTTLADQDKHPLKQKDILVTPLDGKTRVPHVVSWSSQKGLAFDGSPNFGFSGDTLVRPLRVSEEEIQLHSTILSIDPSGSGADETSYAVLGAAGGNIYLLDWGGHREFMEGAQVSNGYSEEVLLKLALIAKKWGVHGVLPEKNFGGGMFTELLRKVLTKVYPVTVYDDFSVSGQKEKRIINTLAPLIGAHQLILNESRVVSEAAWTQANPQDRLEYNLLYQLTHVTYDRNSLTHDDRLDAVTNGVSFLERNVIEDPIRTLEDLKQKQFDDWFRENVLGLGKATRERMMGKTQKFYR